MITTVTSVQRFATKTLYTRARATDGSTMLAPMSPGSGKGLILFKTGPSFYETGLLISSRSGIRAAGRAHRELRNDPRAVAGGRPATVGAPPQGGYVP